MTVAAILILFLIKLTQYKIVFLMLTSTTLFSNDVKSSFKRNLFK